MDDQRIGRRPLFRGKNALHSASIERVRAESVHGLGWKGDESACPKALRRADDQFRLGSRRIDSKYVGHSWVILPSMQFALPFGPSDTSTPIAFIAPGA